jgi:hypothetical protein
MKPSTLDLDPNSPTASKEWKHWYRTFSNFIEQFDSDENVPDKLKSLINCVSFNVYELIEDCTTFNSAIDILKSTFVRTPNSIFARHLLATRRQQPGETLDEFLREIRKLSKDCDFKQVTADQYREQQIRDSFINGLLSPLIRQRLLENNELD